MSADATPVGELPHFGPVSAAWLAAAGIRTAGDLRRLGTVTAFIMVKRSHPAASLNLLYALHGAVTGRHWSKLPAATKLKLKRQADEHINSGS